MREIIASMDSISDLFESSGNYDLAYGMDIIANTAESLSEDKSPEILSALEELGITLNSMLADFGANLKKWGITKDRVTRGISVKKTNPKFRGEYQMILNEMGKIRNYLTSTVKPKILSTLKEIGESTPEVVGPKKPGIPEGTKVSDL